MDRLAHWARPILFVTSVLLLVGASVTVMGMPLIGWGLFGVGLVGALLAFPAAVAVNRGAMDWLAWLALGVLLVGIVLSIPVLAMVWWRYVENPALHDAVMPRAVMPLGMWAGVVFWAGVMLFGLATWRTWSLPLASSIVFIIAAALGLDAELGWLPTWGWGLAVVFLASGLAWVAATLSERPRLVSG